MSNRVVADFLAAREDNPTFENLVARQRDKGLTGDEAYEAIIDTATHSHYAAGTLSNAETRTVYTTFELWMKDVHEQLARDGANLEVRARTMSGMRADLRTWTRTLMSDREKAAQLATYERNPSFDDLVAKQRDRGLEGDAIYAAIIESSTRSRTSVNETLGINPERPPELPRKRGPDDDLQETEENST
jgi:hypothetical protein